MICPLIYVSLHDSLSTPFLCERKVGTMDNTYARHSLSALVKRYEVPWDESAHHRGDYDAAIKTNQEYFFKCLIAVATFLYTFFPCITLSNFILYLHTFYRLFRSYYLLVIPRILFILFRFRHVFFHNRFYQISACIAHNARDKKDCR